VSAAAKPQVVIASAGEADDRVIRAFEEAGLPAWSVRAVTIAPPRDESLVDALLGDLDRYSWVVFTSAKAVSATCGRPAWSAAQRRGGPLPRLAAVGPATAERLGAYGLAAAIVSPGPGADALADTLLAEAPNSQGGRVLWPRGDRALSTIADRLSSAGAVVDAPVVYRTIDGDPAAFAPLVAALKARAVAAVAFLSPSGARATARALGDRGLEAVKDAAVVASIGPTTSAALRDLGAPADVEAASPTPQALALAIREHLSVGSGDRV